MFKIIFIFIYHLYLIIFVSFLIVYYIHFESLKIKLSPFKMRLQLEENNKIVNEYPIDSTQINQYFRKLYPIFSENKQT